ncbi:MAG TPA: NADH-quinone oxidoreductase subunit L [Bdellovibrionales bacterium]|nr:NADH-quinone oxidoreductase subunit L [Bdellovibrionales bacterium]
MSHSFLIATCLLAPFIGFLINGFMYRQKNPYLAGALATGAAATSFVCSLLLYFDLVRMPAEARNITVTFFEWFGVAGLSVPAAFTVDQISSVMILIITGVGSLIHLFSVGYMSHDERPSKYFAYLNLFLVNMLLLVLGDNLLVMFVGWEGVGLCSYLLIGYWFKDEEKAAAGMKAFVVNRIGDAGLLLGIFFLFAHFGTVNFGALNAAAAQLTPETGWGIVTIACLFLFVGAMGKSAQIPLYVWLPDAMAGPTPVSALIHAATMVTAGVYMIVRLNALYVAAPITMTIVATVGAVTALMAATIGLTQWDIKKVLAYSTVSQLGYMFLGVGVGAFGPGMFHLMTHAFFKALMFLGAGSVIHAMHEEQDMRYMGGLKKYIPITHWTFVFGWLAILGLPPFSGFFSKDEILWQAYHSPRGHIIFWIMGVVGAGLTAFYMTRLMALTFWGKSRVPSKTHPHEAPPTMTVPLIILAVLSVTGGWIGIPHVITHTFHVDIPNVFQDWLSPRLTAVPNQTEADPMLEWIFMGVSVGLAGCSAWLAYYLYVLKPNVLDDVYSKLRLVHKVFYNKYWVDEAYFAFIIRPIVAFSRFLWSKFDVLVIDKATYLISDLILEGGRGLKGYQSGNVQQYALYMVIGLVAILLLL